LHTAFTKQNLFNFRKFCSVEIIIRGNFLKPAQRGRAAWR
jgi:hypothetical protein